MDARAGDTQRPGRQAAALLELADWRVGAFDGEVVEHVSETAAAWRDRFIEVGVAGVGVIAPGRGRKRKIPATTVEAI